MGASFWLWLGFVLFILALLALDLGVLHRKEREISVREALWLSFGYFLLAGLFNAGIFYFHGERAGFEFLTGYLIEKSLSIDNIFVFVLVFAHFAVPPLYQHRVLFWGIFGALVMRGLLIYAGAALIAALHWLVFLFGGFLIVTGVKMLLAIDARPDLENNRVIRFARRHLRVTPTFGGARFFLRQGGALWVTPLFLVLVLIELTDLVFAVDSIPAILAITQDPFIVYSSNVFAILGLRALYFALAGTVHRFHYLKYGLSLVLMLIGGKMILNGYFGEAIIPTEIALLVTAALIFGSMAFSILRTRGLPAAATPEERGLPTGWVPGSKPQPPADPGP